MALLLPIWCHPEMQLHVTWVLRWNGILHECIVCACACLFRLVLCVCLTHFSHTFVYHCSYSIGFYHIVLHPRFSLSSDVKLYMPPANVMSHLAYWTRRNIMDVKWSMCLQVGSSCLSVGYKTVLLHSNFKGTSVRFFSSYLLLAMPPRSSKKTVKVPGSRPHEPNVHPVASSWSHSQTRTQTQTKVSSLVLYLRWGFQVKLGYHAARAPPSWADHQ